MSPNQLPPQNTIALATAGMERVREGRDAERGSDRRHESEEDEKRGWSGGEEIERRRGNRVREQMGSYVFFHYLSLLLLPDVPPDSVNCSYSQILI